LEILLLAIAGVFTMILLVLEIRALSKIKVYSLSDEKGIRDYMYKWISHGGSALIFSRDMSWVRDQDMKDMLYAKARSRELSICLPKHIQLSEELEKQGARVYIYPELDHIPQSRFTIANHTSGDARIAVGRRLANNHLIEEFSAGDHPAFYIGKDLIECIVKLNKLNGR
jgi:hypothetical protein